MFSASKYSTEEENTGSDSKASEEKKGILKTNANFLPLVIRKIQVSVLQSSAGVSG